MHSNVGYKRTIGMGVIGNKRGRAVGAIGNKSSDYHMHHNMVPNKAVDNSDELMNSNTHEKQNEPKKSNLLKQK